MQLMLIYFLFLNFRISLYAPENSNLLRVIRSQSHTRKIDQQIRQMEEQLKLHRSKSEVQEKRSPQKISLLGNGHIKAPLVTRHSPKMRRSHSRIERFCPIQTRANDLQAVQDELANHEPVQNELANHEAEQVFDCPEDQKGTPVKMDKSNDITRIESCDQQHKITKDSSSSESPNDAQCNQDSRPKVGKMDYCQSVSDGSPSSNECPLPMVKCVTAVPLAPSAMAWHSSENPFQYLKRYREAALGQQRSFGKESLLIQNCNNSGKAVWSQCLTQLY